VRDRPQRFLRATRTDQTRGEWVDPAARRVKFDQWAEAWERSLVRVAPSTARRYRQLLTNQVMPYFSGRSITGIDYQDVETFIAELLEAGLGPKTAREGCRWSPR
jgi:hypothetical protein